MKARIVMGVAGRSSVVIDMSSPTGASTKMAMASAAGHRVRAFSQALREPGAPSACPCVWRMLPTTRSREAATKPTPRYLEGDQDAQRGLGHPSTGTKMDP